MTRAYEWGLRFLAVRVGGPRPSGPICRHSAKNLGLLELLGKDPFREADFKEASDSGRSYSVLLEQDIIVTYWVDHAAREVRVVDLEWV